MIDITWLLEYEYKKLDLRDIDSMEKLTEMMFKKCVESEGVQDDIYEECEKWVEGMKEEIYERKAELKWFDETPLHVQVGEPERL